MLEKTTRMNYLFDFYHQLLTSKQKSYMQMYYLEDYSLGEIAGFANVARQAVYDILKRTEEMLETYEVKLGLYEKFLNRHELLMKLEERLTDEKSRRYIQQLQETE